MTKQNSRIVDTNHARKLINIINESVSINNKNPIQIVSENIKLPGIYSATKFSGLRHSYTDILLDNWTRKPLYISLENKDAEFLLKTDVKGLNLIYPGIIIKYINEVKRRLKEDTDITTILGKLPQVASDKLMTGNTVLGGPVDYYFFDSLTIEYEFDKEDSSLNMKSGYFLTPQEVSESKTFYLKFKKSDQRIIKNLTENRVDLIKHEIEIVQESDPDSNIINIT